MIRKIPKSLSTHLSGKKQNCLFATISSNNNGTHHQQVLKSSNPNVYCSTIQCQTSTPTAIRSQFYSSSAMASAPVHDIPGEHVLAADMHAMPVPAVALQEHDYDEDRGSDFETPHNHTNDMEPITNRIPTIPPSQNFSSSSFLGTSSTPHNQSIRNMGSGGGGGGNNGRYRCPKCGTHVTFRHGDYEENTFYCATCSGWFLITPSTEQQRNAITEPRLTNKTRGTGTNTTTDPQFVMQYVSDFSL